MEKTIKLTSKELALLDVGIGYLGGSYLKWKRKRGAPAIHKEKCEAYVQECLAIRRKIHKALGIKSSDITVIDNGNVFMGGSELKEEQH